MKWRMVWKVVGRWRSTSTHLCVSCIKLLQQAVSERALSFVILLILFSCCGYFHHSHALFFIRIMQQQHDALVILGLLELLYYCSFKSYY